MTKRKIELALQVAGAVQNATEIISRHVTALGGNYTEALVRIGMGEKQYGTEIDQLAKIYTGVSNGVVAPEGVRIHILRGVIVDESVDWNAAIDVSCPDTPANYDVRKVGGSYPAEREAKPVPRTIVLVNFGKDIPNTEPALAWDGKNKLPFASPRAVFEVVKEHSTLHKELGVDSMVIVSLAECTFSGLRLVPFAWLNGDKRKANLYWPAFSLFAYCWFAFVRKSRSSSATQTSGRCFHIDEGMLQ